MQKIILKGTKGAQKNSNTQATSPVNQTETQNTAQKNNNTNNISTQQQVESTNSTQNAIKNNVVNE